MRKYFAKHEELGWMHVYLAEEATSWIGCDQWVNENDPEAGYYNTEEFDLMIEV